jgi:thiamine-monophosphate kinase
MTAREPAGGEFAIIDRFAYRIPGPPAGEVWIGDDAAVLGSVAGKVLLTTDLTVAGVHADLDLVGLDDLGWRAVVAAVSDIAAMGGRAVHVLVAAAGPPPTDVDLLLAGVAEAAAAHGCHVVGGDLSNAPDVVVAVTVAGVVEGEPGPVLRRGAHSGDHLFVTGPLGASAAGLRTLQDRVQAGVAPPSARDDPATEAHRRPRARLAEGEAARLAGASAMIDVSDGLTADLGHLAEASGVGFRLDRVPVAPGATVEEGLGGGEDYELVFSAPDPARVTSVFAEQGLAPPLGIGECTPDRDQREWAGVALAPSGFEHRWS